MIKVKAFVVLGLFCFSALLVGCSDRSVPKNQNDVCIIFKNRPQWFWATHASEKRWGVPISVQMAIVHQESHFHADARPMSKKLWGKILWSHRSSAQGYAQAIDSTWALYLKENGKRSGDRGDFKTSVDFIGWFAHRAYHYARIPSTNAKKLYLAYYEGLNGYRHRVYLLRPWIVYVAHKVARQAARYHRQLVRCQRELPKKPWWRSLSSTGQAKHG